MKGAADASEEDLARGDGVAIRRLREDDLDQLARFAFTVSITEPLTDRRRLAEVFAADGLWTPQAGAVGIVDLEAGRLVGTSQFYRAAPCIHGFELGYILHDPADRGRGLAGRAVRLFSDLLFRERPQVHRHQLVIEVWNTASWRLAERAGFVREGILRASGFGLDDPADSFIHARTRTDWRESLHSKVGS
jgi:RimJ/RimL family protein N-acetyltransferase